MVKQNPLTHHLVNTYITEMNTKANLDSVVHGFRTVSLDLL